MRLGSDFLHGRSHLINLLNSGCNQDKTANINIELIDDSPFHLRGSFQGPQNSPYEGGRFEVVRFTGFFLYAF